MNESKGKTYFGCRAVANIMGLHEETVRRRVKRGEIPAKLMDGRWVFFHDELVKAKFPGFFQEGNQLPNTTDVKSKRLHVFFVLDASGSMSPLMARARQNLREQLGTLAKAKEVTTTVTLVIFSGRVVDVLGPYSDPSLVDESDYKCWAGMTALNDAILHTLDLARTAAVNNDAVLVSIVTDGQENSSQAPISLVRGAIEGFAKSTNNVTVAFAGPPGCLEYPLQIGIPSGNVTAWNLTTMGLRDLGNTTVRSLQTYSAQVNTGTTCSTSFYAQPVVSDPQQFSRMLDTSLTKLDHNKDIEVLRVSDSDPLVIRRFCALKLNRGFQKGRVFYQLTESEKVQEYKDIIVQDTATGEFYKGWKNAKKLLGIPEFRGTVRIKPGDKAEFKVFIQSTSVNRKLKPGTVVVALR